MVKKAGTTRPPLPHPRKKKLSIKTPNTCATIPERKSRKAGEETLLLGVG